MKFSLLFSILVAAATTAMGVADEDMVIVNQETTFTFVVSDEVEPTQTPEKDQYIENCLTSTYNAIHDPTQYQLKTIEIEEESVEKEDMSNVGSSRPWGFNPWIFRITSQMSYNVCRFCNHTPERSAALKVESYPAWEEGFCTCLNAGPFGDLKTASYCKIEKQGHAVAESNPEEVNDDDMVIVNQETTFAFVVSDEVEPTQTPEKDQYIENCLTSTYNAIHDPTQYQLKTIEIEEESVEKEDMSNIGSSRRWGTNPWRYRFVIETWYTVCRLCNHSPERSAALKVESYPAWEEGFCTCLNAGPFDDLKTASYCKIERSGAAAIKQESQTVSRLRGATQKIASYF